MRISYSYTHLYTDDDMNLRTEKPTLYINMAGPVALHMRDLALSSRMQGWVICIAETRCGSVEIVEGGWQWWKSLFGRISWGWRRGTLPFGIAGDSG